jgi:hypothetical protein
MNRIVRVAAGFALVSSVTLGSTLAFAQPTKKDDHYGYIFHDDVLRADTNGANAARITVVKSMKRDRLIRPRVHFVSEMLKSVEKM